jgi:hypothetical protein
MVTLDVKALYTNMKLELLYPLMAAINPSLEALVKYVCQNNYFIFGGRIYHQVNGIAMGSNCSVSLANLYMARLIDSFIAHTPNVKLFKRYIDDLFLLWKGTLSELNIFINNLNTLVPGLSFTYVHSEKSVVFLDLNISIENTRFKYTTHVKPLSKYQYITPRSSHSHGVLKGFILGELTRLRRGNSDLASFYLHKRRFYLMLLKRGYPIRLLDKLFNKQVKLNNRGNFKALPLVMPWSARPNLVKLFGILNHFGRELEEQFTNTKFIISYTKNKNLSELLCYQQ